jgi:hypothetical protein
VCLGEIVSISALNEVGTVHISKSWSPLRNLKRPCSFAIQIIEGQPVGPRFVANQSERERSEKEKLKEKRKEEFRRLGAGLNQKMLMDLVDKTKWSKAAFWNYIRLVFWNKTPAVRDSTACHCSQYVAGTARAVDQDCSKDEPTSRRLTGRQCLRLGIAAFVCVIVAGGEFGLSAEAAIPVLNNAPTITSQPFGEGLNDILTAPGTIRSRQPGEEPSRTQIRQDALGVQPGDTRSFDFSSLNGQLVDGPSQLPLSFLFRSTKHHEQVSCLSRLRSRPRLRQGQVRHRRERVASANQQP